MKIEDLIELLNNRLNSFKLSKDYAVMSGDLERANTAEVEISGILDSLYKLNLLVDASKTAIETDTNIADIIVSNTAGIVNGYDISSYATDPLHEQKIREILSYMPQMNNAQDMDEYIGKKAEASPVTGMMILSSANTYAVDARLMMAIMEQDSHFGTLGLAVRTLNPGNVGNNDAGETRTYPSWQEGVTAVAKWLSTHRKVETGPSPMLKNTDEVIEKNTDEIIDDIVDDTIIDDTTDDTTNDIVDDTIVDDTVDDMADDTVDDTIIDDTTDDIFNDTVDDTIVDDMIDDTVDGTIIDDTNNDTTTDDTIIDDATNNITESTTDNTIITKSRKKRRVA